MTPHEEGMRLFVRWKMFSWRGTVYFLKCGPLVKIGITRDLEKRIKVISTGNTSRFHLLGKIENAHPMVERILHDDFSSYRVSGEWFKHTRRLKEFTASLQNGFDCGSIHLKDRTRKKFQVLPTMIEEDRKMQLCIRLLRSTNKDLEFSDDLFEKSGNEFDNEIDRIYSEYLKRTKAA